MNMSAWNIAVVGATGQVGSALVELLQKSTIEVDNLYLVGSDNSEGEIVRFAGKNLTVINSQDMDWSLCHFAFFITDQKVTEKYAQVAAESGCVVIDSSGYFFEQENIPLIVPNVNNAILSEYRNDNIIAVASAAVCQLLRSVAALIDIEMLTQLHVTNFIPASLYGKKGVDDLAGQSIRLLNGLPVDNAFFDKQLAFNLLPIAHDSDNPLLNEKALVEQIRKITHNYQLAISIDSIIAPVFYGFSQSVNFLTNVPVELETGKFEQFGIELQQPDLPTPVAEGNVENREDSSILKIKMANLRHSYGHYEQIQFWSVADNVRYLGALMLIETLEILINDYF